MTNSASAFTIVGLSSIQGLNTWKLYDGKGCFTLKFFWVFAVGLWSSSFVFKNLILLHMKGRAIVWEIQFSNGRRNWNNNIYVEYYY